MTEHKTFPGKVYTVSCAEDTTVVLPDPLGVKEAVVLECTAGQQLHVTATAGRLETSSDQAIVTELFKPAPGSNVAPGAIAAAQVAAREAKAAADRAEVAAENLKGAAITGENNTFTATNTFNGALVANGTTTLPAQTTVDGIPLPDLQGMQAALSSFLTGIGELSLCTQLQPMRGCHAKTWNDWAALNPTWAQQKTLIFYAPFATEERADMKINAKVPSSVERGIWISPMPPAWDNDNGTTGSNDNIITNALGANICLYCTRSGTIRASMGNCYYVKKATVITPNATTYNTFLSNLGCLASPSNNEMYIFAPKLQTITEIPNSKNTTFDYMPILSAFSIYAPQLATSFYFSRYTKNNIGQTCAILQKLIDGIGTPTTEQPQTITTLTPSDGDEMQTVDGVEKTKKTILMEAAAAKNWEFIFK